MFFHTWAAYQGTYPNSASVTINIHGPAEVECLQNNFLSRILNIFFSAANSWLHQAGWYINWNKRLPCCFLLHYIILSCKGINTIRHAYTIITLPSYKRTKFVQLRYCQSMTCNAITNYFLTLFLGTLTFKHQQWHKFKDFCLSFYTHQGNSHWVDFCEISYLEFWLKFVETSCFQLKSEKKKKTEILHEYLPTFITVSLFTIKVQNPL